MGKIKALLATPMKVFDRNEERLGERSSSLSRWFVVLWKKTELAATTAYDAKMCALHVCSNGHEICSSLDGVGSEVEFCVKLINHEHMWRSIGGKHRDATPLVNERGAPCNPWSGPCVLAPPADLSIFYSVEQQLEKTRNCCMHLVVT